MRGMSKSSRHRHAAQVRNCTERRCRRIPAERIRRRRRRQMLDAPENFHPAVLRAQVWREGRHGRHGRRTFRRTASGAAADVAAPRPRGRATIVARRCARRTHSRHRHRGRAPAPAQTSAPDGCEGAGNSVGPRRAPLLACPRVAAKSGGVSGAVDASATVLLPPARSTATPRPGRHAPPLHGTSLAGAGGCPAGRHGGRLPVPHSLSDVTGRQARPCCCPPVTDCCKN